MEYDWGPGDPVMNVISILLMLMLLTGWAAMLFYFLVYP